MSDATYAQLGMRFRGEGAGARSHNRVFLSEATRRVGIVNQLNSWWAEPERGVAVLEGEDGTGKTWVAAEFIESLPKSDAPVVFWLDSLMWAEATSIGTLIDTSLASTFCADPPLCSRLKRKIFRQWQNPVLLVLDGANERGAWEAADRLLREYSAHAQKLSACVRILLTSRPLVHRTTRPNFWQGCQVLTVQGFDDCELNEAFAKEAPDIAPGALGKDLRELARIPRYFRLCIRLRGRLASLQHLNRQVLLWADLQDKLENGDPQFASWLKELGGSPQGLLATLAKQVGWPASGEPTLATAEILSSVPNFLKARADLAEQRIVLAADHDVTTLSADHVVLGWALVLRQLALCEATGDRSELRDRLLRELEPAASNDDKIRALHVAALLTHLEETAKLGAAQRARAALFSLWVSHHNAGVTEEALGFFVRSDLAAYAGALEDLFEDYLPGTTETRLVAPLAAVWRQNGSATIALREILVRWLRLIYPGDASGSKDRDRQPPSRFTPSKTPQQLRLSYAAIGVISFRPDNELLPALLDCARSYDFCFADRDAGDFRHRHSIKSPGEQLGVLLRWGYTEATIPALEAISATLTSGSIEAETLLWFARSLRMSTLPARIGPAKDIHEGGPESPTAQVERLRDWLRRTEEAPREVLGFGSLASLAVRRDLPLLEACDIDELRAEASTRGANDRAIARRQGSLENAQMHDLLPWLARYAPDTFETTCLTLWQHVLRAKESWPGLLDLDELIPAQDPNSELVTAILRQANSLCSQPNHNFAVVPLTEVMLLHGKLDQVMEWLEHLETMRLERAGHPAIGILPLPAMFEQLAPTGLASLARERFEIAFAALDVATGQIELEVKAQHWLTIYAYAAPPTKEVGAWALALLDQLGPETDFGFPLFCLLAGCSDWYVLQSALAHPALERFQTGFHAWRWASNISADAWSVLTFEELRQRTSFNVSGWVLLNSGRDEELRKRGEALAAEALAAVGLESVEWSPTTEIKFLVNRKGGLAGATFDRPEAGGSSWHDISSPAWGVERQAHRPNLTDQDCDAACDRFTADMRKLEDSPRREFGDFNAAAALLRWGELEPKAFVMFAEQFLADLSQKRPWQVMDLSFFATATAIGLLRLKPERALQFQEFQMPGRLFRVFTFDGALNWATRELWSPNLNPAPEVLALRRQLLLEGVNDEVLFWHVAAAHDGANEEAIARAAEDWLAAPVARDRALAVTLLGFQGDPASHAKLMDLRNSDASYWVREHSAWALEVCALELACKRRYAEVLRCCSLRELAIGLAELRLAFSPMVRAWRHSVEEQTGWPVQDTRMNAYLDSFWHHWGNTSKRQDNLAILGRRLCEYCRGERLKNGVTSRQSPWWHIDE